MGGEEVHKGILWGYLREREHLKDQGVDRMIILKWIFEKWNGGHGLDRSVSRQRQAVGSCECGNKPSSFIKCGEFLD
jgi:hypothetical protein